MRTSGATTGRARMTDLRDNVFNQHISFVKSIKENPELCEKLLINFHLKNKGEKSCPT